MSKPTHDKKNSHASPLTWFRLSGVECVFKILGFS